MMPSVRELIDLIFIFSFFWLQERNPVLSLAACAIPR